MAGLWNAIKCSGERFHGQKEVKKKRALSGRVIPYFKVGGNCEAMAG